MRLRRGIVAIALGALTAPGLHAQDTTLVEAVMRLEITHGPVEVVPAFASATRLYLPLLRFLQLTDIGTVTVERGHRITTALEPAGIPVRFDTDSLRLTVGDSSVALGPRDARWEDGELYVYTEALTRAFGVIVGVDWEALTAVVARTEGLPVARRERRERQHAMARRARPVVEPVQARLGRRPTADGAVLDWTFTGATDDPFGNATAELGLGAALVGGSLELQYEGHRFPGGGFSRARASWVKAFPQRTDVRQLRLGDVATGGRRARSVFGVVATNQPFLRSSEYSLEEVVGRLPPGWEIELYDAYGLLDFGQADPTGEFRVALPLRYGANPYDVVLYGPRGEVERRHRTIRVPFSRLPAGRLEYAVGGGLCRLEACGVALSGDVRYGVNDRVTAQAGWDILTRGDTASDLWQPYAAVSAAVLPSVSLTTEAVANGLLRGSAEFEPTPDLRLQLAQTFFDAGGAPFLGAPLDRRRTEADLFWQTYGRFALTYQASAARASGPTGARAFYRALATARRAGARYAADLRHLRSSPSGGTTVAQTVLDLNGDVALRSGPPWLRWATVGGGVGVDLGRGLASIRGALGRTLGDVARLDAGLGWFRDQGGVALELGLSTTLAGPRLGSQNRFSADGGASGVQYADGSLLWDRTANRVRLGDGRDLGRGGVTGVLFLDRNGDGRRAADEPGLAGIPVRVGGRIRETDRLGRFSAWELFPFQATTLQVDTTAFDNPFYVVPDRILALTPLPNRYERVEIPVVVGAEVSGRVEYEGRGLGGVRLAVRDVVRQRVIRLLTFADGGFYYLGLPPGQYELGLANGLPPGVRGAATPIRFTVPPGDGDKRVADLVLRLERAP